MSLAQALRHHAPGESVARRRVEAQPGPADTLVVIAGVLSLAMALAFWWHDRWPDFAVFYHSSQALRRGLDAYAATGLPNLNGPLSVWLLTPLTYLDEQTAATMWLVAGGVALAIGSYVTMKAIGSGNWLLMMLAVVATQAGAMTIRQGQLAFFLMLLLTTAWVADRTGHTRRAAALLGALAFFKPFYGVFAIYMLWKRGAREFAVFAAVFALLVVASLALGLSVNRAWLETLRAVYWQAHQANTSLAGMASRLFDAPPVSGFLLRHVPITVSSLAKWLTVAIGVATIALTTLTTLARARNRDREWACLCLAAMLLSPLSEIYYLAVAAAPIAAVLPRTRQMRWLLLPAVVLVCLPYEVVDSRHGVAWTFTLNSAYFWGIAGLWLWTLPRLRDESDAQSSTA